MTDTPPTRYRFKLAGLGVAVLAFVLTRAIVAEAMSPTATVTGFLLGQGPFLVAGLAVSLVGVGLAVSAVDASYVRTVAVWAFVGTGVMGAVLASSILEASIVYGAMSTVDLRLGSKVLIGGLVGGTLTGFTIARNRRHRAAVDHQNDRLVVLNRLLRHHVLNKANIISGYSDGDDAIPAGQVGVLRRSARHITDTIEGVSGLTESYSAGDGELETMDLLAALRTAIDDVDGDATDRSFATNLASGPLPVAASGTLPAALSHLLGYLQDSASGSADPVSIATVTRDGAVAVRIETARGLLTDRERTLLEEGGLPNYDDPNVGFELPLARLLLEGMNAIVSVDAEAGAGEAITIWFHRGAPEAEPGWAVAPRAVVQAGVAGILAGVVMGLVVQVGTDQIAVIGSLYGTASPTVGWITHLFHSAVFGVVFAAGCSVPAIRQRLDSWVAYVGAAGIYAFGLWVFAASVVMPLWLSLVGVPTPVPTFQTTSLIAHLIWGAILGVGVFAFRSIPDRERLGGVVGSLGWNAIGSSD